MLDPISSTMLSLQATLTQTRAYREAVIAKIPPRTKREQAARLRRCNTSGLSGVARLELTGGAVWRAALTAKVGLKRRSFAVAEYGEAGAERWAIAQRLARLDALLAAFTLGSDLNGVADTCDEAIQRLHDAWTK